MGTLPLPAGSDIKFQVHVLSSSLRLRLRPRCHWNAVLAASALPRPGPRPNIIHDIHLNAFATWEISQEPSTFHQPLPPPPPPVTFVCISKFTFVIAFIYFCHCCRLFLGLETCPEPSFSFRSICQPRTQPNPLFPVFINHLSHYFDYVKFLHTFFDSFVCVSLTWPGLFPPQTLSTLLLFCWLFPLSRLLFRLSQFFFWEIYF